MGLNGTGRGVGHGKWGWQHKQGQVQRIRVLLPGLAIPALQGYTPETQKETNLCFQGFTVRLDSINILDFDYL